MSTTNICKTCFKDVPRRRGKVIDFRELNRPLCWRKQIAEEQEKLSESLSTYRESLSTCPICDCRDYKLFVDVYKYCYVECVVCGHIFSQMPPNEQAILGLYANEGDKHSAQGQIYIDEQIFKQRIDQIARPKIDYCSTIIPVKGVWMDLGCGTGELLMAAAEKGWQVKGVETDPAEVVFGKSHGLNIIQGDVNSLKSEELQNIKVLSLLNLLEHMRNPMKTLVRLVDVLPADAYVVIEVPRHPSLSSFVNLAFPHLAYRHIYSPDHLHIFTENSMQIMLEAAGLEAVAVWVFGQDFQDLIFAAAANAELQENEFLNKIISLSATVQTAIDDADFSDVLFVIALKR